MSHVTNNFQLPPGENPNSLVCHAKLYTIFSNSLFHCSFYLHSDFPSRPAHILSLKTFCTNPSLKHLLNLLPVPLSLSCLLMFSISFFVSINICTSVSTPVSTSIIYSSYLHLHPTEIFLRPKIQILYMPPTNLTQGLVLSWGSGFFKSLGQ